MDRLGDAEGADWRSIVSALRRAGLLQSVSPGDPPLSGLADDSRLVEGGELFLALPGVTTDGLRFVPQAMARGAAAVIAESVVDTGGVPVAEVADARQAARLIAAVWYGRPAQRLDLIGVTGTNGKTTTTALIRHLLNADGTVGSLGTLGAIDGAGRRVPSTAGLLTTPGPVDLQATLARMVAGGTSAVVLEASSHSLDQGRLDGLEFSAAVFTNLSRDHLDYHGTMAAYRSAKLSLGRLLGPDGAAVLNRDDDSWREAALEAPRRITFGLDPAADLRGEVSWLGAAGSRFEVSGRFGRRVVELPLVGGFNVANALGAAACAIALGVDLDLVAARLATAPQVPGRMERIARYPCPVIRDYAHTPDALDRVLAALRPLVPGRLIVVFGCGGDRDRGKRPLMGRIAAELSDVAILTSDNPRTEDPETILDDVEQGMGSIRHRRIVDRREAIAAALEEADPDDTVVLAGKGHETYQVIGTERQPFDEVAIVRELGGREG